MPDDPETRLVLRQADQLRTGVANFESGLESHHDPARPFAKSRRTVGRGSNGTVGGLGAPAGFGLGLLPALIPLKDDHHPAYRI